MSEVLTDSFGRMHRYLRISVTDRCNLRCRYCMPAGGFAPMPYEEILSYEEIVSFVQVLASWGLSKVRITGGEPLVRRDLASLIAQIREIPGIEKIGLTTNGLLFAENAKDLKQAGLNSVNISLDTLRPERFESLTRHSGWDKVMRSIAVAQELEFPEVKVNAVVLRNINDDEILNLAALAQHQRIQMRFIESMPFSSNGWNSGEMVSYEEIVQRLSQKYELQPIVDPLSPYPISQDFNVPGFAGQLGVIASMTRSFCGGCERLRLQADGSLKACLFEPAHRNVRSAIRKGSIEDLALLIQETLWSKSWEHVPAVELAEQSLPVMTGVGG